jgi:hypothetical protein
MDALCMGLSAFVAIMLLVPVPFLAQETLAYYPYPTITLPGFDPLIGLLMLLWLSPVLVIRNESTPQASSSILEPPHN